MTTYVPAAPARGEPRRRANGAGGLQPYALVAGAIAAVQGVVVGALGLAGYFYLDDIDMTSEAAKHPYGWDYVTLPLNDHLTPGLRTFFWLSAHFAPYDNEATVLARVLLQAVATLLMAYLLGLLFGPGRTALLGLGLYAFSPLLVPSLLSLSSGVNLVPTHIGILLLLVMHVRYEATRELRYAAIGALGLLLALLFWEKAVLSVVLVPLLTLLYLSSGGIRSRLVALVRSWPAGLLYAGPVVAFFGYFLTSGDYAKSGSSPTAGDAWDIVWHGWVHSLGPTLIGGPWTWFTTETVYYSAADPGPIATVAGQLAALVLSVLAVRRNGWWALRAWLLPATVLVGSAVLLAAGRFEYIGVLLARNFHYFSELAIPLVLAAVLLLVVPVPAAVTARGRYGLWTDVRPGELPAENTHDTDATEKAEDAPESSGPAARPIGIGLVVAVVAYALSYAATVGAFEKRWVGNPVRDYMTTAIRDLETNTAKGPITIYDTTVPVTVSPIINDNRRASDVFRAVERHLPGAVRWDDATRPLYMFDQGGHLLRARFVEEATSADQPGVFCPHPLRGVGSVTVMLNKRMTRPDSFVRLDYLSQTHATVSVRLADGARTFAPRRFTESTLVAGGYSSLLLGTPDKAYDRVVVSTTDPDTVLCVSAKAGNPEPAL